MSESRPTLVLAALAGEFECARRALGLAPATQSAPKSTHDEAGRWRLVQTGIGPARAAKACQWAIEESQPARVLVVGFAGGLDPNLKTGDVMQAEAALNVATGTRCAATPYDELGVPRGLIATVAAPVTDAAGKRTLFESTGAAAVDMESAPVAKIAADRGIPFAAIRAITDAHDEALDPRVASWIDEHGDVKFARTALDLATRPTMWKTAARLANASKLATANLTAALERLRRADEERR